MGSKVQKMLSGSLYILLAVFLGFAVLLVMPVYRKYTEMQRKVSDLEQDLRQAQEECRSLILEVHDLEHSALAAERIAREKFNFCREGEQVLIYKMPAGKEAQPR